MCVQSMNAISSRFRTTNMNGDTGISYGQRLTFKDADAPQYVDEGDGTQLLGSIQLDT